MSKALSLKLKDDIFKEVEEITHHIDIPRNAYINMAIDYYNKLNKRKKLKNKLLQESVSVRNNSLEILREFEKFEDEFE